MFVPDDVVFGDVSAILKSQTAAQLQSGASWSTIIPLAHLIAYNTLYEGLIVRGFTSDQIAAWDRGIEFERMLSIAEALNQGRSLAEIDKALLEQYTRYRDLLQTVFVTNAGIKQWPQDTPGNPAAGPMSHAGDHRAWPERPLPHGRDWDWE